MRPMGIDRALCDPQLLGAGLGDTGTWSTWLVLLKAAFGLPLGEPQREVFRTIAGDRDPPGQRVRELWCVLGRRSGKSRIAAALAVYFALLEKHDLAPGEVGHVLVLAASQQQAQTVFRYACGFVQASAILSGELEAVTANEIRLRGNIIIGVHANSFRTVRGRTLLA
jgi:phage terminase large subunit-like protein